MREPSERSCVQKSRKRLSLPTQPGLHKSANANDPMCIGEVCHQDDIGITFGTCTNPTSQQTALSNEIMAGWAAFAKNGNANIPGKTTWNKVASSTSLNEMLFSSTDTVNQTMNPAICGPIFGI